VLGAYPGGCVGYEHVAGADWEERMAAGEVISDLRQLGGDYRIPEAKTRFNTGGRDVINQWTENAGGFGDPLEREIERVLDDVLDGEVTVDTARRVYGVVIDGNRVDEEATQSERDGIRSRRLADLENVREDYEVGDDLPVEHEWSDLLKLVRAEDGKLLVQAAESGVILGPLGDNWRDVAPWRRITPEELGPRIRIDERLEARQYVDPKTGRSLWVDVVRIGDPVPSDFVLKP
jgi:N-methylhydantoinase B